jgi:hypothetical protein
VGVTDPEWRDMLVTRVLLHIDEMSRELISSRLLVMNEPGFGQRVAREYAGRIVDDISEQLSEGSRPRTVESLRAYLAETRERPADEID